MGRIFLFFCAFVLAGAGLGSFSELQAAPFKRAMIMPGAGFQFVRFLGMLQAAKDVGKTPDLIIGTCGGSFAAAIANLYPHSEDQLDYLKSEEFHHFFFNFGRRNNGTSGMAVDFAQGLLSSPFQHLGWMGPAADPLHDFILNVPDVLNLPGLKATFRNSPYATIITAARALSEKRYKVALITDYDTSKFIHGYTSPIAKMKFHRVLPKVEVLIDRIMVHAVRASISDPSLIGPSRLPEISIDRSLYDLEHDSSFPLYLGGAIDLWPIELAHAMADEVIMPFVNEFEWVAKEYVKYNTFGYDKKQRLDEVFAQKADVWIDQTQLDEMESYLGLDPYLDWGMKGASIYFRTPRAHEAYEKKIQWLWDYGYALGREAFSETKHPNDRSFIGGWRTKSINRLFISRIEREKAESKLDFSAE